MNNQKNKSFQKHMHNTEEKVKHQADNLNKNIKSGAEELNKKIHEGGKILDQNFNHPTPYNYLIFAFPILLILLTFIPMKEWVLQIVRLVIFLCMGYVLFFEDRSTKKRDRVFFIAVALTILFNPVIPFYIPGTPINLIAIGAFGYLAYETQMKNSKH